MERYTWGQYEVEVDEAVTRAWYAQAGEWDCECGQKDIVGKFCNN